MTQTRIEPQIFHSYVQYYSHKATGMAENIKGQSHYDKGILLLYYYNITFKIFYVRFPV